MKLVRRTICITAALLVTSVLLCACAGWSDLGRQGVELSASSTNQGSGNLVPALLQVTDGSNTKILDDVRVEADHARVEISLEGLGDQLVVTIIRLPLLEDGSIYIDGQDDPSGMSLAKGAVPYCEITRSGDGWMLRYAYSQTERTGSDNESWAEAGDEKTIQLDFDLGQLSKEKIDKEVLRKYIDAGLLRSSTIVSGYEPIESTLSAEMRTVLNYSRQRIIQYDDLKKELETVSDEDRRSLGLVYEKFCDIRQRHSDE